uniref:EGF-like domain-containing protein n=1 Tax=Panagrellus redivivus TaxID=6233 RepID=A0A7E4V6W4_PANRE
MINPTTTTTKKVTTTTKKTTKKPTTTTKKTTKKTTTTTKKTTTTTKKTTTTTTTTTTVPPTKHSWNGTFSFRETINNDQPPCCVRIEYDEETANASSIPCVITKSTLSSASITYPSTKTTFASSSSRTSVSTENVELEKYSQPPNISQFTTFAESTTTNRFLVTHTESRTPQNPLASQGHQDQSTLPTTVTAKDVLSTTAKPTTSSRHNTEDSETTRSFTSEINSTLLPTTSTLTTQKPSTKITDSDTTVKLTTEVNQTFSPTTESTVSDFPGTNTTVTATSQIFFVSNSSVVPISTTNSSAIETTENTAKITLTSTNEATASQVSSSTAQNSTTLTTEQVTTEPSSKMTTTTLHLREEHSSTTTPVLKTTESSDIDSTSTHEHTTSAGSTKTPTLTFIFSTSTKDIETTVLSSMSVLSAITSMLPATFLTSESTSITQSITLSSTPLPKTTVAKTTEGMSTSTTNPHMKTSTVDVGPLYGSQTTDATSSSQPETSESSTVIPTSQAIQTSSVFVKLTDSSSEKSTKQMSTSLLTSFKSESSERFITTPTFSSTASSIMFIETFYPSLETSIPTTRDATTTTSQSNADSTTQYFQEESSTVKTCTCANSGTCNADGLCVCANGYFGASCDLTLPSSGIATAATAVAVVTAVSQSSSSSVKYLWPRYSASVRMPTNPHEFFRLMATYFLTVALGVNSMFGTPKSNDVKHMPMCAMSYLFGTGAFFLSLTAMIFEALVDALTLSGVRFNAWIRPAERRPRCFSFWPTITLYVLIGVAPTAGLWLKHWTDCVTTRSCIGSLGYGDFDRSVKDAAWLQFTVTLFYLGIAAVIGILAIACNSFDICRCRRRTEAWSINPYVYGREIWPLEANACFWLVAIQPVLFGVCWMSYMHVNDAKTVKAQWINLILTSIYSVTSTIQSSLTTSQQLSNTVCSLMTMLPQRFLFLMPSTDHVSLKDKQGILKDQMHAEDWKKFELKDGPVPAYPIRYDSIPFGLAQYMCRLWTTNYIKQRANGATVDTALTMTAKHFLLQLPDLRTINTFQFAHLFCNWVAEVREKDSDSVSLAILQKSLRIMDRQMDLSVPPPMIVVKECGTDTEYRRKISHLTPMDGEDQVASSRKTSKHCDVSLDDTQPAFIGPKTEEHSVSALVPHELFVAFNMDDENIDANMQ